MPFTFRGQQTVPTPRRTNQTIELYGENGAYLFNTTEFRRCRDALAYYQNNHDTNFQRSSTRPLFAKMRTKITATPRQQRIHDEQQRRAEEARQQVHERDQRLAHEREETIAYIRERQSGYNANDAYRRHIDTLVRQIDTLVRQIANPESSQIGIDYPSSYTEVRDSYLRELSTWHTSGSDFFDVGHD